MEESDFWVRLEYRICAEFKSFDDKRLHRYWCDGLIAEEYDLLGERPAVRGRAWCGPTGQEPWTFVLLVDPATRSQAAIDWSALLPGDQTRGWFAPNPRDKTMTIDPLSGAPD